MNTMPQTHDDDRKPRLKRQALLLGLLALGAYAAYMLLVYLT